MNAWLCLFIAGLCEVVWALCLKHVTGHGGSRWLLAVVVVMITGSITLLGVAMKTLPAAVAYAGWVAFGTVGTAAVAWSIFGEQLRWQHILCLSLIVIGVIGLHQGSSPESAPDHSFSSPPETAHPQSDIAQKEPT